MHEAFYEGALYDRRGEKIIDLGDADEVILTHILDHPGEHLMIYTPAGKLQIWIDRTANDAPGMAERYKDPLYYENVRHSAVGYNQHFPILNY